MPQNDSRKRFKKKAPKRPRLIETSPEDDALADLAKYGAKFDELLEKQPDWFASSVKLDEEEADAELDAQLGDAEFIHHVSKWLALKHKHRLLFFLFLVLTHHDILFPCSITGYAAGQKHTEGLRSREESQPVNSRFLSFT